eukprot:1158249-Pelagomonas_calceolata.AAC.5
MGRLEIFTMFTTFLSFSFTLAHMQSRLFQKSAQNCACIIKQDWKKVLGGARPGRLRKVSCKRPLQKAKLGRSHALQTRSSVLRPSIRYLESTLFSQRSKPGEAPTPSS